MSNSAPRPLERAIIALLKPLVRLVLKRGIAFGQFAELAKQVYVEVAKKDFAVPGRKMTVSRVAVLTGLTRKEARRLFEEAPPAGFPDPRRRINRAARVLSAWVQERDYRDGRGGPASLEFGSEKGPSFSQLVTDHGGDVTPRAVLDELLRVGAVERLKNGRLRPLERAYIPQSDEAEKLAILGADVGDLISSIDHNLDAESDAAFYQRKVAYDNLPASYLPRLRTLVRRDAQRLLERFDAEMSKHDLDVVADSTAGTASTDDAKEGGRRAMVGIYYFEDDADDEE
jgi:hypothetical protein